VFQSLALVLLTNTSQHEMSHDIAKLFHEHGLIGIEKLSEGRFRKAFVVEGAKGCKLKCDITDISLSSRKESQQSLRDATRLTELRHPHIVTYCDVFLDSGWLCMCTEHFDAWDLADQIRLAKAERRAIATEFTIHCLTQATTALKYIHEKNILHRDLSPESFILLKMGLLKLCNFKCACVTPREDKLPYYRSPETLRGRPEEWPSDIWSLGCIVYELCSLKKAFEGPTINTVAGLLQKMSGPKPVLSDVCSALRELCEEMLNTNPMLRPSANRMLQRPTLKVAATALCRQQARQVKINCKGHESNEHVGSYKLGHHVEYKSRKLGWLPTTVVKHDAWGRVQIDLRPGTWLADQEQLKLRPCKANKSQVATQDARSSPCEALFESSSQEGSESPNSFMQTMRRPFVSKLALQPSSSVFEELWRSDHGLKDSSLQAKQQPKKLESVKMVFYQAGRLVQHQDMFSTIRFNRSSQQEKQISLDVMPASWTPKDRLVILPRWDPQRAGIVDGIEAQARAKFLLRDIYISCSQAFGSSPASSAGVSRGEIGCSLKASNSCTSVTARRQYRREDLVEYSGAQGQWQKATVADVGAEGQLLLDILPETWLSSLQQLERVRPEKSTRITLEERREICHRCRQIGGRPGAEYLHKTLPALYWGVTKAQVSAFLSEVATAKLRNESPAERKPYCQERFNSCGPNVHQVTAQFIKVATGESAKPFPMSSYALLKNHTGGMECDLFVSHCWEEGVFEFGKHVLNAWPADCTGAYICFLANPQNLDIREMVSTPQQSPFYKVLTEVPRCMLMVTNSRVPIHSRLWCCYEAFCAWQINEAWAPDISVLDLTSEHMAIRIQIAGNPLDLIPQGKEREKVKALLANERAKDKAMLDKIVVEISDLADERHTELLSVLGDQVKLDIRDAECSDSGDREHIWQEIRGHEVVINSMIKKHMYDACH